MLCSHTARCLQGKTLAFVLPAYHLFAAAPPVGGVSNRPCPRALVVAPTRELALQIHVQCVQFAPAGCAACCVYGGVPLPAQQAEVKKACKAPGGAIVVATPGRLVDLMDRASLSLSSCGYVVLDEADRMLDMGFEPQVRTVARNSESGHQLLLTTATTR